MDNGGIPAMWTQTIIYITLYLISMAIIIPGLGLDSIV